MGNENKVGKISPIAQEYSSEGGASLASSLTRAKKNRFPNTVAALTPFKEKDGTYRTGLDPDASYIKAMEQRGQVEEAAQERARVQGYLEHAMLISGITDLGPKSDYYSKIYHDGFFRTNLVASAYTLRDGVNTFALNEPSMALTYYWLRVHPFIAPSHEAYLRNHTSFRCPQPINCSFFVEDEEVQVQLAYNKSTRINKAINQLDSMSPVRRLKVARLLGLPVTFVSTDAVVYTELDKYIKDTSSSAGTTNLTLFENLVNMEDENLEIKFLVREALDFGVYRVGQGGIIYKGSVEIAKSESETVSFLSSPNNQEEFLAVKHELEQKKSVVKQA